MSNIVNFAEKSGLTELKELRQALDTAYDSVNEQYSKVLQIEAKLKDLQALYDMRLHSLYKKIGYANIPVWQCQQKSPFRSNDSNINLFTMCQFGVKSIKSTPNCFKVFSVLSLFPGLRNP